MTQKDPRLLVLLLACCAPLPGCFKTADVLSSGDTMPAADGDAGWRVPGGNRDSASPRPEACQRDGLCTEIAVASIDRVDLLFAIDNSASMAAEQAALTAQFPRLLAQLSSGDRDGDGAQDFPPAKDLHLGVVSSDLGEVGVTSSRARCVGLGDDGIMQSEPRLPGCLDSYPRFLTYLAGLGTSLEVANDLACIATLGTDGCDFGQPLETALKALWPSTDDRLVFLDDGNVPNRPGHGDGENSGFLRNDPLQGQSLIAVVLVSDDDDCSSNNTSQVKNPPSAVPTSSVDEYLAGEGLKVRCAHDVRDLNSVTRFANGLRALRPGREQLVVFAAIVGVPPDVVAPDVIAGIDFTQAAARDELYERIAEHEMMRGDDRGTPDLADDLVRPSCRGPHGSAFPPHRIVEAAKELGANGIVQSICADDYTPAIDAIVDRIAPHLGAQCLDRTLRRDTSQLVACDVIWELPPAGQAAAGTPTRCDAPGHGFLLPPRGGHAYTEQGGARCRVAQLPARQVDLGRPVPVPSDDGATEGWYYDDFSEQVEHECLVAPRARIMFTASAKPPSGVRVLLDCTPDAVL
jgi:hypothetical protein